MSQPSSSSDRCVTPAQVWEQLTAEHQARVIRLIAQLALNFVNAQSDSPLKEVHRALATRSS